MGIEPTTSRFAVTPRAAAPRPASIIYIFLLILEQNPCLPVKILLRPLKKRFTFHFTGTRQTARIDRPEWFLTQTLTWIKLHQHFVKSHVQPIAEKLDLNHINTVVGYSLWFFCLYNLQVSLDY